MNVEFIRNSLINTFKKTNKDYESFAKSNWINWGSGGSTSVVGIIYKNNDDKSYHLSVANSGDSRGVFCCEDNESKVFPMSYDHKPNSPSEKARIEESGGFISKSPIGPWRVNGILATSRSFGDFDLFPQVIADPDVIDIEIGRFVDNNFVINEQWNLNGSAILILASDGFWDVFKNQEAASLVKQMRVEEGKNPEEISQFLVQQAYERRSGDNITVLIVYLDELLTNLYQN